MNKLFDPKGIKDEELARLDCNLKWKVEFDKASIHEQLIHHFDFKLDGRRIESKDVKRINRSDAEVCYDIIWVETKTVGGHKGWLYGGATHFLFGQEEDRWLIKASDLRSIVERLKIDEYRYPKEIYYLYGRRDRGDEMLMIRRSDIEPYIIDKIPRVYTNEHINSNIYKLM